MAASPISDLRSPISGLRSAIPDSPLFVLVAGEASGDLLGADLIDGLRAHFPGARFAGIGGAQMIARGFVSWAPIERLSVMGLVEVLRHLPALLRLRRSVLRRTLEERPAAFVGIDAPDFNLGLERRLKRAGVPTTHYVSPSVWAWREGRAATIGRSADRVLCLFPMEPAIYARHGVDARFVGHPLAGRFPIEPDRAAARRALGLRDDGGPILALLPGSRVGEIRRLGRDFLAAAALLRRELPGLRIVAPMANAACRAEFTQLAQAILPAAGLDAAAITLVDAGGTRGSAAQGASPAGDGGPPFAPTPSQCAMVAADAVLLASGTAALEAMLAKRPMVVAYRVAPLTYRIVKALRLLRTDVYSLPNILAGRTIVPEHMQDDCTPRSLCTALAPLLRASAPDAALLAEFTRLHEALRAPAHAAAAAVAQLVASQAGATG